MDIMQIIGLIILATPFVGLFLYSCAQSGFWSTVTIYALLGLLFAWVYAGVHLLGASTTGG